MFCLRHNWHCTYSEIYFLNKFYIWVALSIDFITKPLLPIAPEMPPRSSKKKFITCYGCLSSCLHRDTKLIIAVFFVPIFYTLGGFSKILVFYAKSGLFFVNVSVILVNKNLYLDSLVDAIYACLFYYCFAFSLSAFFLSLSFFLMSPKSTRKS